MKTDWPQNQTEQIMVDSENKILSKKYTAVEIKMVLQSHIPAMKIQNIIFSFLIGDKKWWLKSSYNGTRIHFYQSLKLFIAKSFLYFPWTKKLHRRKSYVSIEISYCQAKVAPLIFQTSDFSNKLGVLYFQFLLLFQT